MSLFYRCHCSEILEAPDGTQGEKAVCPTCGKVVVIPKDAVVVSDAELEEARGSAAEAPAPAVPQAVVQPAQEVAPGSPSVPTPAEGTVAVPPGPDQVETAQEPAAEIGGPEPAEPGVSSGEALPVPDAVPAEDASVPSIAEVQSEPSSPAPVGDGVEGEGDSFEEIFGTGEEQLPEIPEIPTPDSEPAPAVQESPAPEPAPGPEPEPEPEPVSAAPPASAPAPKRHAPQAVKRASKRAPIRAGGGASSRAASRRAGRSRGRKAVEPCPECGAEVPKGAKVCPECGHRFKGGGVLKWLLIFVLVVILAAGGLFAAVWVAPDKLPPALLKPAAGVGDALRGLGLPIPENFGRPDAPGESGAGGAEGQDTAAGSSGGEAEAVPAEENAGALDIKGEEPLDMDVTVDEPAAPEATAGGGEEEDLTVQ